MKQLLVLIALIFLAATAFSQDISESQVPQACLDRLHHVFPQSVDLTVKWAKEKNDYKATLTIMDTPAILVIDSTGRQKRLERRINDIYLPDAAKAYMKKMDAGYQVVNVTKIVDEKDVVSYKTAVKIITNINFDEKGKVIGGAKK
jgi:hypothetical protein